MVPAFIKNAVVNKVLKNVLDGNKGSNILTAILVPVLAAGINWDLFVKGLHFQDTTAALEVAKVIGIVILGFLGWLVGKFPKLAPWLCAVEDAAKVVDESKGK